MRMKEFGVGNITVTYCIMLVVVVAQLCAFVKTPRNLH